MTSRSSQSALEPPPGSMSMMRWASWWPCVLLAVASACYPNPDALSDAGGLSGTNDISCTDPSFPLACPTTADVPAGCWRADMVCSTVADCAGTPMACTVASQRVFCASDECCVPPLAGGTCNLPDCGCVAGEICAASTPTAGLACFTAGTGAEGTACSSVSACASGLGCVGGLCKTYCLVDTDCPPSPGARHCVQTTWTTTGANIPGVLACEHVCDPVSPQSPKSPLLGCPAGYGCNVTSLAGVTDCAQRQGTATAGLACTTDNDCAPGNYCDTVNKVCAKYCYAAGDCPTGKTCQFLSPTFFAGASELGACGP